MNEVAISYCSVKRVLKCMCQRGRGKVGKREDQVATEVKEGEGEEDELERRTERQIRSVEAELLIVQVFVQEEILRILEDGGCCFAFLTSTWNRHALSPKAVADYY